MVTITSLPHAPDQNHLLAALPRETFERISPHLELIKMPLGEVLYESSGQLNHVYFPTDAIVSLHYSLMFTGQPITDIGCSSPDRSLMTSRGLRPFTRAIFASRL